MHGDAPETANGPAAVETATASPIGDCATTLHIQQDQSGSIRTKLRRDTRSTIRPDCHRQAWLTTSEAAHISGLDRRWVRQLCAAGRILARPRGAYRVSHKSLQEYLSGSA